MSPAAGTPVSQGPQPSVDCLPCQNGDGSPSAGPPRHPQRTCVACRRTRDKHDLVRLAHVDGDIVVDWDQRAPGRGSSICPDLACVDRATARDAAQLRASLRGGTVHQVLRALTDIKIQLESAQHAKEHNA